MTVDEAAQQLRDARAAYDRAQETFRVAEQARREAMQHAERAREAWSKARMALIETVDPESVILP